MTGRELIKRILEMKDLDQPVALSIVVSPNVNTEACIRWSPAGAGELKAWVELVEATKQLADEEFGEWHIELSAIILKQPKTEGS